MATRYQAVKQGGPFEIVSASKPELERNEVLVNIKAVALNPLDYKQLDYGMFISSWPATLGSDGAGIVEAVGEDVKSFKPGDEVFARFTPGNNKSAAFQSIAAVHESKVGRKPGSWSFEDAASLTIAFVTAVASLAALEISLPFIPGSQTGAYQPGTILILGGSSSVGASTIQVLRLALPNCTILTTSSSKHHEALKALGASAVLDYRSANILNDIKNMSADGQGVEAIIDAVGSVTTDPSLLHVLTGSKKFAQVITGKDSKDIPADVKHYSIASGNVFGAPGGANIVAALGLLLEEGKYKVPLPVTVVGQGFDAIGDGLQTLKKGVSGTKLVVCL
ncbi:hypothetical protein MMC07_008374 [Pseudocyphellaria aurata]|nr:hypothetical protein [Pseudocyphellaria aurata]